MVGQQRYMSAGIPSSSSLSAASILPPATSASVPQNTYHQDFTPYSAVSSFNLPANCDSTLLTPNSSAASPPLHQPRELVRQYPMPPGTPQSQRSDSPVDQKMYSHWQNHFDMNGNPSGTTSPSTAPSVPADFSHTYIQEGRRTPAPPVQFMNYYMDMPTVEHQESMPMRTLQTMPMDTTHAMASGVPEHPNMSCTQQPRHQERRSSTNDPLFHHSTTSSYERALSVSPRQRMMQGAHRVKKPRTAKRQSRSHARVVDPADEYKNCRGEEVLPNFTDDIPDQERFLWEARWRHRDKKGDNMWMHILEDYQMEFKGGKVPHGDKARENLQMKFKRSRCKYLDWLPDDNAILLAAWKHHEETRYKSILETFWLLGGSRNMCLGPEDIEVRLASHLKVEENIYMDDEDDLKIRRRRRVKGMNKKQPGAGGLADGQISAAGVHGNSHALAPGQDVDAVMEQVLGCRAIKEEHVMPDMDNGSVPTWARHPLRH
ncbi:hypothetical protein S40293_09530 [Stachybotrys chartarum IBT 40293]|nr:hypothetical protein S40293_09530 [Stachybotrys chartarum IBT 40293]